MHDCLHLAAARRFRGLGDWGGRYPDIDRERKPNRSLHQQRLQADLALSRERGVQEMKLAERKADLERHAADWQRKAEFAEEVLAEFGEMVALFRGMGQQTPKMEPASKSL